eukprot:863026-Rhodomonas_salina.1
MAAGSERQDTELFATLSGSDELTIVLVKFLVAEVNLGSIALKTMSKMNNSRAFEHVIGLRKRHSLGRLIPNHGLNHT